MKVLVVGGTGVTGALVRSHLEDLGWEVDTCSRHASDDPHHRVLDLGGSRAAVVDVLRDYDWVVACLGPFERWQGKVARLCAEAHTNYLDVNDSIDAREDILAVDAEGAGIVAMTGAGLCPGISTALMMGDAGAPVRSVRSVLHIGAGQPAGAASVQSMFATLHADYRVLQRGKVRTCSQEPVTDAGLVGYECPDLGSVGTLFPGIDSYGYYVNFAALSNETVAKLQTKRLFTLPLLSGILARMAAAGTTKRAVEANAPEPATLEVTTETDKTRTRRVLSGLPSYRLTALAAATSVRHLVETSCAPGMYEAARLPALAGKLLDACRSAGATVTVSQETL